jgi:hypothetical protein
VAPSCSLANTARQLIGRRARLPRCRAKASAGERPSRAVPLLRPTNAARQAADEERAGWANNEVPHRCPCRGSPPTPSLTLEVGTKGFSRTSRRKGRTRLASTGGASADRLAGFRPSERVLHHRFDGGKHRSVAAEGSGSCRRSAVEPPTATTAWSGYVQPVLTQGDGPERPHERSARRR